MIHKDGRELKNYEVESHLNNDFTELLTMKNKDKRRHVTYLLYKGVGSINDDNPTLFVSGSFGDYVFDFKNEVGAFSAINDSFQSLKAISKMNFFELACTNTAGSKCNTGLIIFNKKVVRKDLAKYLDRCGITEHKYSQVIKKSENKECRKCFKTRYDLINLVSRAFDPAFGYSISRLLMQTNGRKALCMLSQFDKTYCGPCDDANDLSSHLTLVGRRYTGQKILRLLQIGIRQLNRMNK